MSESHSTIGGKATTTTTTSSCHGDDPWQTAAQVAATRHNEQQHHEPATWSERPPWLSSKSSSQQQQQQRDASFSSAWTSAGVTHLSTQVATRNNEVDNSSTTYWTRHVVQGWHIVDGIVGLLWLSNALILCQSRRHHSQSQGDEPEWKITTGWQVVMVMTWYVALLLLLRSILGGLAMALDWCDHFGLRVSAILSIMMGLSWMITSVYGFFGNKRFMHWLELHYHSVLLSRDVVHVLQHSPALLWLLPLIACLLELIRWFIVRRHLQVLQQIDDQNAIHQPRRTKRPWWWQSNIAVMDNNNLSYMDPLLGSGGAEAQHRSNNNNNTASGGWFSWFVGGSSRGRDDASVEYASISEDWASRTEEDPLWWSREEEMITPQRSSTVG